MSPRKTILLSLLFFAGLAALWWADYARIPTAAQRRRMAGRVLPELIDVKPGEVRRVEIDGESGTLAFERRGDRWWLTSPLEALADRSRLESLVASLKGLPKSSEGGSVRGPAGRFGLERPLHVVRLYAGDSRTPLATLEVGKAIEGQRYVRAAGQDEIDLVDGRGLAALDLDVAGWRERALFYAPTFDVQALAIRGAGRPIEARRTADGRWRLTSPIEGPGDGSKIDGLLADFNAWRVAPGPEGFVEGRAGDPNQYGLDPPRLTIELATAASPGRTQTLQIGGPVPGREGRVYARRGDGRAVLMIDAKPMTAIPEDAHDLRGLKLADLAADRVDLIRVVADEVRYLLARGAKGWVVLEPTEGPADRQAVQGLLKGLDEAQVHEFLGEDKAGKADLDRPRMTVEVWEDALPDPAGSLGEMARSATTTPPAFAMRLGRGNVLARLSFARVQGDPAVLLVPNLLADLIPKGPLAYRDRTILSQDGSRIGRIIIERPDRTITLDGSGAGRDFAGWRLTAPVQAPADPRTVAQLVLLLSGLRAESLVGLAEGDLSAYGLDRPQMRVRWALRGGSVGGMHPGASESEDTLEVGGPVPGKPGSRYARIAGRPMIFAIAPRALEMLTAEPRDRRVFGFDPGALGRLRLTWPGREVALARRVAPQGAASWTPEGGEVPAGLDLSGIDDLARTLSNLTTPEFVQYEGPFRDDWGLASPAFRVDVELKGGAGLRILRLGARDPAGRRLATAEPGQAGAVFVLADPLWERWVVAPGTTSELPRDVFAH